MVAARFDLDMGIESKLQPQLQLAGAVFTHQCECSYTYSSSMITYRNQAMCPDTSFMSSAYTSFVERLHCQVGSEGWYGVRPPYVDVDLPSNFLLGCVIVDHDISAS